MDKKWIIVLIGCAWALCSCGSTNRAGENVEDLARWVNPMIGASSSVDAAGVYHGLGKTFPGAATPFGMVQVSPNTITGGDNGSGYSDEHRTIEGFAMTQMSGIGWNGDLGNFLVMPTVAEEGIPLQTIAGKEDGSIMGWRSAYDKKSETAQAGYYSVVLSRYQVKTECTATTHCGFLRFTFPENTTSRIQIDLARRVGGTADEESVEVLNDSTFCGRIVCTPDGGGWGDGQGQARYTVYFYATLSVPLDNYGFWCADIPDDWSRHCDDVVSERYLRRVAEAAVIRGESSCSGKHVGFFVEFPTRRNEEVVLKVALSYVDVEGARRNYFAEGAGRTFDKARADAYTRWNEELSKVKVEGGDEASNTVFYTALYHTMIDPRIFTDADGRYWGGDGLVHHTDGTWTKRTIFSGWDVFRSQMPLQSLINPRVVSDLINSLITLADESGRGYFERWELMNAYSGCMLGNPALPVIADAWSKGIRSFDVQRALAYGKRTSHLFGNDSLGYTPSSFCISHTLEYAYADWCLGKLAEWAGDPSAEEYLAKGQAWRNIFDEEKRWFRPRRADGSWEPWPRDGRTKEWYGSIEADAWQQGWFVPQDIEGMVEAMGGEDAVVADLDSFFTLTPADLHWNAYYNHANEPVHFVPYLYNRLHQPWKTQYWTRFICQHAYRPEVAGIVGNEDVGQMSAWYVLSASGIHPVCPADGYMELTSPVFPKVTFTLGDAAGGAERRFTIISHHLSHRNIYIQRAVLDGKEYNSSRLPVEAITAGGTLHLYMGPTPNTHWGTADN